MSFFAIYIILWWCSWCLC